MIAHENSSLFAEYWQVDMPTSHEKKTKEKNEIKNLF